MGDRMGAIVGLQGSQLVLSIRSDSNETSAMEQRRAIRTCLGFRVISVGGTGSPLHTRMRGKLEA